MVETKTRTSESPLLSKRHSVADSNNVWRVTGVILGLSLLVVASSVAIMIYDNPMEFATPGFWIIVKRRATSVAVIALVSLSHSLASVAFQTATNNRILTPSIMGFEALYILIQTSAVFFLGISGVSFASGPKQFIIQTLLMVAMATSLYTWLLSGRSANLHLMLLVGVILGGGLSALSTFMQRLLTPSEFDVLTARLFGNLSNANFDLLPIATPVIALASALLYSRARRLDVLALGRDTATNLGISYQRELKIVLVLVAVLMASATSLVGPMTFLGFLAATLAYQSTPSYKHSLILPISFLISFAILGCAYFILRHIFYAQGAVMVIIELIGGIVFLVHILRKGRL